jgi:hypothetical protein
LSFGFCNFVSVTILQLLRSMHERQQPEEEEADSRRAQAMIQANQQPDDDDDKHVDKWCKKRKLLVLQLGRADGKTGRVDQELHGFGLGAAMHVLSVALSYGIRHNRTLLLPDVDSWWYTDPAVCKSRSFSCFFERVSPCSTERHVGSEKMQDLGEESERPRRGSRARVVVAPTRLDKYLNHEDNRCARAAACIHSRYIVDLVVEGCGSHLSLRSAVPCGGARSSSSPPPQHAHGCCSRHASCLNVVRGPTR